MSQFGATWSDDGTAPPAAFTDPLAADSYPDALAGGRSWWDPCAVVSESFAPWAEGNAEPDQYLAGGQVAARPQPPAPASPVRPSPVRPSPVRATPARPSRAQPKAARTQPVPARRSPATPARPAVAYGPGSRQAPAYGPDSQWSLPARQLPWWPRRGRRGGAR